MYNQLKKVGITVLPKGLMRKLYQPLRGLAALPYIGKKHRCNICGMGLRKFVTLNNDAQDQICPKCGSLARKRFLRFLLESEFSDDRLRWLHFTPSKGFRVLAKKKIAGDYRTTDFETDTCDYQFDVQNMPLAAASFDRIICYHILEHIPDDKAAMEELYRILSETGKVYLQVPFTDGEFQEDNTITDPAERLRLFGQEDHVRYYDYDTFFDRLSSVGFKLEMKCPKVDVDPDSIEKFGLNPIERMLIATK